VNQRQFPDIWYSQPYSWRQGFISGGWTPTPKDKEPPLNPCALGTEWERQWQEGFEYRKKLMRGEA
jgi:hypothetical protein